MRSPPCNRVEDRKELLAFMQANGFACEATERALAALTRSHLVEE